MKDLKFDLMHKFTRKEDIKLTEFKMNDPLVIEQSEKLKRRIKKY